MTLTRLDTCAPSRLLYAVLSYKCFFIVLTDTINFFYLISQQKIFQEQGNGVQGVKINTILKHSPLPDQVKQYLLGHMVSIAHNILSDRTVFMMIVFLVIFDDPDPTIVKIRDQYTQMLR